MLLLFATAATAAPRPPGDAVATAHPLATAAGLEILEQGGNAFDAAVAISAALAVAEPASSGIGGGGFWLLHRAADGRQVVVDGRETAPAAAHDKMYRGPDGAAIASASRDGPLAAGIPGAPAAWAHLARHYGSMPLADLLAPAVRIAREGFELDPRVAARLKWSDTRFSPAAARVFRPRGRMAEVGETIVQRDLAATLEAMARGGHDGFYRGPVARRLVEGVRRAGGIWTEADLAAYRVIEREPLVTRFRDQRVVAPPPPSAGGIALAQILQVLEQLGWPSASEAPAPHLVIEAMRRAYRDRTRHLGDPEFVDIPESLVSAAYARQLAAQINPDRASTGVDGAPSREADNTTHFSVIDRNGNRVAGTLSINLPFGSGFMPPGTGVLLNDEMDDFSAAPDARNAFGLAGSRANAVAPGKRPLSSMTPVFVEGPRGVLVIGTPGGSRIITMVLLGILGYEAGLDPAAIVALPRYHHQHVPDEVQHEAAAFDAPTRSALEAMGHVLSERTRPYGNMQLVWWDVAGRRLEAASDPRGVGTATVRMDPPRTTRSP